MDFGCSKKISYSESLEYFDYDFSYILQNNGVFQDFIATTDLVYNNFSLSFQDFINISFFHANNDLLCSGVKAEYAILNLSLSYEFNFNQRKEIIKYLKNFLASMNVKLLNAHTVVGNDFFISWSLISKKNIKFIESDIANTNIFLTKSLGGSSNSSLENVELMKQKNDFILEKLDNINYITDISGYGIYNILSLLNKQYNIKFNISKISMRNNIVETMLDCDVKRNLGRQDIGFTDFDKKLLFSSEFNGPLLVFSKLDQMENCFCIGKTSDMNSLEWFIYE